MPNPYVAAGIGKGIAGALEYDLARPEREAKRAEARTRQEFAETKLAEYKASAPTRQAKEELALEQAKADLRKTQAENLRNSTYNAFRLYDTDGDARHLNTFLQTAKTNPIGKSQYGHIVRADNITQTPEVEAMLRSEGYDPATIFGSPELAQDFVVETHADGSRELVYMPKMYAGTGYTNYMTQQQLTEMTAKAKIEQLLRGEQSADTNAISKIAEEENLSFSEAAEKYYTIKSAGNKAGSKVERVADDLQAKNPDLSREEALVQATQLTESRTASQKDVDAAEQTRQAIDEVAGGDFFEADLTDPTVRRKVGRHITALEKFTGKELTTEDKRVARNLRSLTQLGGKAGTNITDAEAGPIDSVLRGVKKYISNEIPGTEGTAAYETFRNIFRNALYGASLTQTETNAFNAAAGTLKQQTGPVLQQLLVQMEDVRSQMQSIYDMNDEYVAQYYLGRSLDEVDEMVVAIEERVDYFKSLTANEDIADTIKVDMSTPPVGKKQSLDTIFGS